MLNLLLLSLSLLQGTGEKNLLLNAQYETNRLAVQSPSQANSAKPQTIYLDHSQIGTYVYDNTSADGSTINIGCLLSGPMCYQVYKDSDNPNFEIIAIWNDGKVDHEVQVQTGDPKISTNEGVTNFQWNSIHP